MCSFRHAVQDLVGEELPGDRTPMDAVAEGKWGEEEGYFGSYTHFKIHEEMLKVLLKYVDHKNLRMNCPDK